MVSGASGAQPSQQAVFPEKLYSTEKLPLASTLKTSPHPSSGNWFPPAKQLGFVLAPPPLVLPYRLSAESLTSPPAGAAPFAPPTPKLYNKVKLPPGLNLNNEPAVVPVILPYG